MKAVICTEYGPPEVLKIKEIEKPAPKDNEILIKVYDTTVNSGDCRVRSFNVPPLFWLPGKLMLGFTKPKNPILGSSVSGVIEEIGINVKDFKKGDRVIANTRHGFGGYTEYMCISEKGEIVIIPDNVSFKEAASIPFGGLTALHFLRKSEIKKGQKILVYGASGSVGTYAVQLAKYFGAEVTGVCSTKNLEIVKKLGADKVIDYTKEDFTKCGQKYDIVFDAAGFTKFSQIKNILVKKGYYLHVVMLFAEVKALWHSLIHGVKVIGGGITVTAEDLNFLCNLVKKGDIKPVIDKVYPLEEIVEAHKYVDTGHKVGNVVINIVKE